MLFEIIQNGVVIESRELADGSWKIGRSSDCDIKLNSPQVSKQHGLLVIKGGKAAIVDVGSSNGIFVNGILVKKQRIEQRDEVVIASYLLRVTSDVPAGRPRRVTLEGGFEGNAAIKMDPVEAPPTLSSQEKFLQLMDERVLVPWYQIMKSFDWRWLLATVLIVSLSLCVFFSVYPIMRWGKRVTTREALARAHTVVAQTVRENYRLLSKANETAVLTVEACEAEKGMLSCYIADPQTGSILAPTKLLNKTLTDRFSILALEKVKNKEENVSVEAINDIWVVAEPIAVYSPETNERLVTAVAVANFQVDLSTISTFEPIVESGLFALLISLCAYFFIFKMVSHPVLRLREQLDAALKGEAVTIDPEVRFEELENLAQVIGFSVTRATQGGGLGAQAINPNDPDVEDRAYEQSVAEFDEGTTDALLLLDTDKKVRFVGHVTEDMLSLRNQYAKGQNISDACRDSSFAGTAIDMVEHVVSSLGSSQTAQLEINGVNRAVSAIGHKNIVGEIRFILIVVKMGEG